MGLCQDSVTKVWRQRPPWLTVEFTVEYTRQSMETIQVVLEKALLDAADRAARRRRVNRSALVREALRAHLARLATVDREARDREGYGRQPNESGDFAWDKVTSWPDP